MINPVAIKERIVLDDWPADDRDFLLNAINHWVDALAIRAFDPPAITRIRKVIDQTPSFSSTE